MVSDVSLLILAGGVSSRMGFPKHLLPFSGGTVLDFIVDRLDGVFNEILVAGRNLDKCPPCVIPVEDVRTVRCPLVGILSGLLTASNPRVFVLGCDMPFIEPDLARMLCSRTAGKADVVVPVIRGFYEPLCAVYNGNTRTKIAEYIDAGKSKTTGFFPSVKVDEVPEAVISEFDPHLRSFVNLNTPGDYMSYYSRAKEMHC